MNDAVQGVGEHEAQLCGVAVHGVDLRPPVQVRLRGDTGTVSVVTVTTVTPLPSSAVTHVGDDSVQRVHQDEVERGRRRRGETHLRTETETRQRTDWVQSTLKN